MFAAGSIRIETWTDSPLNTSDDVEMLSSLLHICVRAGASVSFVLPFSHEDAKAFWKDQVVPAVATGSRCVLVARFGSRIAGTVQLDLDTQPNQPHRAEVRKLLVHPEARRSGIARSLMTALETEARKAKRTLLTLDTVTGGPAEALYRSLGYVAAGVIPGYSFNYNSRLLEPTTVMYKDLNAIESFMDRMEGKGAGEYGESPSIRRATPDDAQGILDCLRRAFEPYRDGYTTPAFADTVLTHETLQKRLSEMRILVAADTANRIIGTIAYKASNGEGRIRGMAVLPENQGRGVAAALLKQAESGLRGLRCTAVTLDTTRLLSRAQRFYEQNGFSRTGEISSFFGMELFAYRKEL